MTDHEKQPLFVTTVSGSQLDPSYVQLRDSANCADHRLYLESLWKRFSPYADSNFHSEMQRCPQFQGRMWEMRLACVLMDYSHTLVTKISAAGPDVTVATSPRVHFEAVAPLPTKELTENYETARRQSAPIPEDEVILRYTTAIDEKSKKALRYLEKGIVHSDEPFVIAVSGANIPFPTAPNGHIPWIIKLLFGLGKSYVEIQVGVGKTGAGIQRQLVRQNRNNAPIESDLFLNEKREHISAVLFSPHDIKNRPEYYGRPPGNDFIVVHNPHAKAKIEPWMLRCGREWAVVVDGDLVLLNDWRPKNAK